MVEKLTLKKKEKRSMRSIMIFALALEHEVRLELIDPIKDSYGHTEELACKDSARF